MSKNRSANIFQQQCTKMWLGFPGYLNVSQRINNDIKGINEVKLSLNIKFLSKCNADFRKK